MQVSAGTGSKLQAGLVMPYYISRPGPVFLSVDYQNVGDSDMPAPLFHVTGPAGVAMGLSPGAGDGVGELRFLGYSDSGPADCTDGVFCNPSYDPVRREVDSRLAPRQAPLSHDDLYQLTAYVGVTPDDLA